MNFKVALLLNILSISMICEVIALITVQRIKYLSWIRKSWQVNIFSILLNLLLGILFCFSFTDLTFYNSLWVSFFSFIGADTVYKALEEKGLLKKLSDCGERPDKNE